MSDLQRLYRKKLLQPMRPYIVGEDLSGVSVNAEDSPEEGGMIAWNPDNPADQWYVAKRFFEDNYELADGSLVEAEKVQALVEAAVSHPAVWGECQCHSEEGAIFRIKFLRVAPDGKVICDDCWNDFGDVHGGSIIERGGYKYVSPRFRELPGFDAALKEVSR